MTTLLTAHLVAVAALLFPHPDTRIVQVAGDGIDHLTTAIVHSKEDTAGGMIQRSTETVELHGDLTGRVLYHVTSVFDFAHGTLVNTGDQVFSARSPDRVVLVDDSSASK